MLLVTDLDFTLTKISTLLNFMEFLEGKKPGILKERNRILEMRQRGEIGYLEVVDLLNRLLSRYLSGMDETTAIKTAEESFSVSHFRSFVFRLSNQSIRWIIVSATPTIISKPYADYLGAELIAPSLEIVDGYFTGEFSYRISGMDGKKQAIIGKGISAIDIAMGDSIQDLSFLEIADYPFAVYPQPELEAVARLKGIPVMKDDEKITKAFQTIMQEKL